jgi:uncharacterized protein with NAD-binding domain and iron-sulfur cluster
VKARTPIKIAIVGGGCAALTTAFELTRPEQRGRYEVTVYQMGWRLGGKGASGRGASGRIEEHGLHLWMGYYDNAFHLMRECYREMGRDPRVSPMADWTDAFKPDPHVGVMDRGARGWQRLMSEFPPSAGLPGDPYKPGEQFTLSGYLVRGIQLLYTLLVTSQSSAAANERPANRKSRGHAKAESLAIDVASLLKYGQLATLTAILQGVTYLESVIRVLPDFPKALALTLTEAVATGAQRLLQPLLDGDDESRCVWEIIDLVLACIRGAIMFGLTTHPMGLDAINEYDSREWLRLCGASERSLNSAFMRGLYDLAFAYVDGDPQRPSLAAGQGIRGSLRMFFGYRGALFWKMQAGMGDVVFAPLYEVLARRGVKFRFFHRLERVHLADPRTLAPGEKPFVTRLDFDVQATTRDGAEYQPLIDVKGLPCWPSLPDWKQLKSGERMAAESRQFESFWDRRREAAITLEVAKDFDFVVLGVSLGVIPHVCSDFIARDPRWRAMVENVRTTATQAFQVWLRDDLTGLGWDGPSGNVSAYAQPWATWANMSHLASAEQWTEAPGSIAYFCGVLPWPEPKDTSDSRAPMRAYDLVRRNAIDFLNGDVAGLWPAAQRADGSFRWHSLLDSQSSGASADEHRFDNQFWTANVNPSDRYVLSLPGTSKYRISPLDETYDNLTITGDWTDGYNFGCVEAAVMSGRLAAHALSCFPPLEEIFGYDHP